MTDQLTVNVSVLLAQAASVGVDPDIIQAKAGREDWSGLEQAISAAISQKADAAVQDVVQVTPGDPDAIQKLLVIVNQLVKDMATYKELVGRLVADAAAQKSVTDGLNAAISGLVATFKSALAEAQANNPDADLTDLEAAIGTIEANTSAINDAVRAGTVAVPSMPTPDNSVDGLPNVEAPAPTPADAAAAPIADPPAAPEPQVDDPAPNN